MRLSLLVFLVPCLSSLSAVFKTGDTGAYAFWILNVSASSLDAFPHCVLPNLLRVRSTFALPITKKQSLIMVTPSVAKVKCIGRERVAIPHEIRRGVPNYFQSIRGLGVDVSRSFTHLHCP